MDDWERERDWEEVIVVLIEEIKRSLYDENRVIDGSFYRQQAAMGLLAAAREVLKA